MTNKNVDMTFSTYDVTNTIKHASYILLGAICNFLYCHFTSTLRILRNVHFSNVMGLFPFT